LISIQYMRNAIRQNGHLKLTGEETKEDLRTALLYLRQHTYSKCTNPALGTPIEALIPDITVLTPASTRSRNVHTVDMSDLKVV
jgi:hypothetical protein